MLNLSEVAAEHKDLSTAPDIALCPRCGTRSPRNEIRHRSFVSFRQGCKARQDLTVVMLGPPVEARGCPPEVQADAS